MTTATPKQCRLFFALWPDEATRAALARLQFNLHGNKTRYRNFHITLAFLGDQPAEVLPQLQSILTHFTSPEMTLTLDKLGHFPRNRIAWAGMSAAPDALVDLQADLTQQLAGHHVAFESRALFRPHITLVRDSDAPPDIAFEPIIWHAKQVALVQSSNEQEGMAYNVLASQWLKKLR
jgi:2'-5' RNA ligase